MRKYTEYNLISFIRFLNIDLNFLTYELKWNYLWKYFHKNITHVVMIQFKQQLVGYRMNNIQELSFDYKPLKYHHQYRFLISFKEEKKREKISWKAFSSFYFLFHPTRSNLKNYYVITSFGKFRWMEGRKFLITF